MNNLISKSNSNPREEFSNLSFDRSEGLNKSKSPKDNRKSVDQGAHSGKPTPRASETYHTDFKNQVVDFSQRANKGKNTPAAISEEVRQQIARQAQENKRALQAKQEAQRLKTCRREAIANILVASVFSGLAAGALSNFLPQYSSQRQNLAQISINVKDLELKVESLRAKFPIIFDAGKSKESSFRRNGWFKRGQVPIKQETKQEESP